MSPAAWVTEVHIGHSKSQTANNPLLIAVFSVKSKHFCLSKCVCVCFSHTNDRYPYKRRHDYALCFRHLLSPHYAACLTLHLACKMMKEFSEQLTVVRIMIQKHHEYHCRAHNCDNCFKMHTDLMN